MHPIDQMTSLARDIAQSRRNRMLRQERLVIFAYAATFIVGVILGWAIHG